MKRLVLFFTLLFIIMSCGENESFVDQKDNYEINKRKGPKPDCDPVFTAGSALDIFGVTNENGFANGWKGSFEQSLFPCPEIIGQTGNCCPGSETKFLDLYIPFSLECNLDLSVEEQEIIFETIQQIANENRPKCPDGPYVMSPVAYDVLYWTTLCCTMDPPCVDTYVHPCDCYEDFPDSDYWGCCQSYSLFLEVKYAYNGPCLTAIEPG